MPWTADATWPLAALAALAVVACILLAMRLHSVSKALRRSRAENPPPSGATHAAPVRPVVTIPIRPTPTLISVPDLRPSVDEDEPSQDNEDRPVDRQLEHILELRRRIIEQAGRDSPP